MAHMELKKYSMEWAPANYLNTENGNKIFGVSAGEFVAQMGYRVLANFGANCVINVGDDGDTDGYENIAKGVTNGAAANAVYMCVGAYVINSMGKLYKDDDTIDLDYACGVAAADGKIRVYIIKGRMEP